MNPGELWQWVANSHRVSDAMRPEEIEQLRQLFGAYFHQDWDLDAPDANGIIDRFIADQADKAQLTKLAALVDAYAKSYEDDSELERALVGELWCEYLPGAAGTRARDWLWHVAARLRAAASE